MSGATGTRQPQEHRAGSTERQQRVLVEPQLRSELRPAQEALDPPGQLDRGGLPLRRLAEDPQGGQSFSSRDDRGPA